MRLGSTRQQQQLYIPKNRNASTSLVDPRGLQSSTSVSTAKSRNKLIALASI
jgi:hypothetical protein